MENVVIIGGGIAGLVCLNALLDRGISPLLFEASTVGSLKMGGEFLVQRTLAQLTQWEAPPVVPIKHVCVFGHKSSLDLTLLQPAGAFARHQAEIALAFRAQKKGGRIVEHVSMKNIVPAVRDEPHRIELTSGDVVHSKDVIFATGISSQSNVSSTPTYIGFKAHIQHIAQLETLFMFSLEGGYLSMMPISSDTSNLMCLVKKERVDACGGTTAFLHQAMKVNSVLRQSLSHVDVENIAWAQGYAPRFGLKRFPTWPRACWIGDALAGFYPVLGYGLTYSVDSAILAADYYLKQNARDYHRIMRQRARAKFLMSKGMHHVLQRPEFCRVLSSLLQEHPGIAHVLLKKLDD